MTLANAGFEDAGANPGDALNWTRSVVSTAEELIDFGGTGLAAENFETAWSNDAFVFEFAGFGTDLTQATYANGSVTPSTREGFEYGWDSNQSYAFGLGSSTFAVFSGHAFEGFEAGWGNDSYKASFVGYGSDLTRAVFDSNNFENFEQGWDNGAYITAFVGFGTDLTRATFKENVTGFFAETFEGVALDQLFSVDPSTDVFTATAHGFTNGDKALIIADPSGTVPEGLSVALTYYIVNKTTDTFKLALTIGGTAVDVRSTGSGGNLVRRDPALYWVDLMQTI